MNTDRVAFGICGALASCMLKDLAPLFICVLVFELVDLITGIWKSKVIAERKGEAWGIESAKLRKTLYKTILIFAGLVLAYLLGEVCFNEINIDLPKMFCGFACAFEMWSFLENAAVISEHPIFRLLQKFMKKEIKDKTGMDV